MSAFISEKVAESSELIVELQAMCAREDSIRLGSPDDVNFSREFLRFWSEKLGVFVSQLRDELPSGCLPFFGNSGLFVNLTRILDLLKPSTPESAEVRATARISLLEVFRGMPVSFDPSMCRFHLQLCSVLWDMIERDSSEEALRVFGEIYKTPHQVLLDSEFANRLSRFVVWLRSVYTSRMSNLLVETANCAYLLTQLFPGAGESFLVPLIGDMMASIMAGTSVGAVKTLTFVAYVSRSSRGELLRPFDQQICRVCVNLLRTTALDLPLRRELVLNVRALFHVPELSQVFLQWIDDLFDESVFVGLGKSAQEFLRPVVVAALADFTNSVRDKIPVDKLRKIIAYFTATLGDSDLPIPAQFAASRILLTLVDQLFNKSSNRAKKWPPATPGGAASDGSDILRDILRSTVEKFSSLMLFIPRVISIVDGKNIIDEPTLLQLLGRQSTSAVPSGDLLVEGVRELRSLIRTLLLTAKMTIHCLTHRVSSRMLTKSDVSLIDSLVEDSLKCAHMFSVAAGLVQSLGFDASGLPSSANGGGRFATSEQLAVACSIQEERELIDQVGNVLIVMPGISLTDLLAKRIGWLLTSICTNSQLMSLVNCVVTNVTGIQSLTEVLSGYLAVTDESSVSYFLGPSMVDSSDLVTYVMPSLAPSLRTYEGMVQLYGLRKQETDQRDVIISILKTIARQVQATNTVYLEPIVKPFVVDIIQRNISGTSESILFRLGLLRYMFRLMGSGIKTSSTIKELADLGGEVLELCLAKSLETEQGVVSQLWLEIGLTFPIRLKSLIPVFESAMTLMIRLLAGPVCSLSESPISVGLTVLESWVDGLTPDFLFPLVAGHATESLVETLFLLTEPAQPVHTAVSGSHAVRATKILGKLGARARFHTKSHNLIGRKQSLPLTPSSEMTVFALDEQTGVELDISASILAAVSLLSEFSKDTIPVPVSLQDVQDPVVVPEQELADAFALLVASGGSSVGLIYAGACRSSIVSERARIACKKNAHLLMHFAVSELSGDPSFKSRSSVVMNCILPNCPADEVVPLLAARLLSTDWRVQLGACWGLDQIAMYCTEDVLRNLIKGHMIASDYPEVQECISQLAKKTDKKMRKDLLLSLIVPELIALPVRSLPEEIIVLFAQGGSVKDLLAGAPMELIANAISNNTGPVFQLTSFLLEHGIVHECIQHGIQRALEWTENEDQLSLLHGQRRMPSTAVESVAYLFHRAAVRARFTANQNLRVLQSVKLFAVYMQSNNLDVTSDGLPCYLPATREWSTKDRISVFLARCLFSYDTELVKVVEEILVGNPTIIASVWTDSLLPLCVEIASRAPFGLPELQGLGRLIACASEDSTVCLFPLLIERLHSYLSVLRERTYAPMQAVGPGTLISWRAGTQSDSIVAIAVLTLAAAARTTPAGGLEKVLALASQLEAALPGTCGSGQISSPFMAPLIAGLCYRSDEAAADELLTKLELHKVFPLVAELVSTPRCLGLRKALQDKCHLMSDSAGLMMRTAVASLVSVLARFDPSYLWIQHCSSTSSLISVLIRGWEASIQTLSSSSAISGLKQTNQLVLGPGGIVGPADINGFEGRIVAWTIMQFIRAPFLESSIAGGFTVTSLEQSVFRVRLVLRLACSLSLRSSIEVCAIQHWFLTEAPSMTTNSEKIDLIAKSIDLIQDPNISAGCKFALLRYVVLPQIANDGEGMDLTRIQTVLFSPHNVMDEAIRVELLKLLLVLPPGLGDSFVSASVAPACLTPAVLHQVQLVVHHTQHWDATIIDALITGDVAGEPSLALVHAVGNVLRLKTSGIDAKMWRWIVLLDTAPTLEREAIRLLAKRATSVEGRGLALDVALWLTKTSKNPPFEILANFFLKHCVAGPDAFVGTNPVSPTLTAEFMARCSEGMQLCCQHKIRLDLSNSVDMTIPRVPHNATGAAPPELVRHCKQLVAANRMLTILFRSGQSHQSAHLCHLVNTSMVSTDKSVCVAFCALVESWTAANAPASTTEEHPVLRCIVEGITAGLQVAANVPCRIKLHPLNPHSAAWSVTPYMAISVLVAFLRGLPVAKQSEWMNHFQPALLKAVTQGARSLVFSLLPQHIHHFPLGLTKYPAPALEQSQELGAGGAAYPGSLQGPEFAVPTLLHILRLTHLATDTGGAREVAWENCVLWLMESLGPFVALATNGMQSFAQVLVSLNFTVPQTKAGGLASVVPAAHVAALVRQGLEIVARWNLGVHYQLPLETTDHQMDSSDTVPALVLSGSTAMVGQEALLAHFNIESLKPSTKVLPKNLTALVHAVCLLDGFGTLTPICDGSVQKLLGFVPKRAVTCFPGSALSGKPQALFALARQVLCDVLANTDDTTALLPALLVAAQHDQLLMDALVTLAPANFSDRLKWILTTVPWEVLGGRNIALLFVHLLLAHVNSADGIVADCIRSLLGLECVSIGSQLLEISVEDVSLFVAFLSRPILEKQGIFRNQNLVAMIIKGVACSAPPSVLLHLANQHGLYYEVLSVLDAMGDACAAEEVLKAIGEADAVYGSQLKRGRMDRSLAALMAHERWEQATETSEYIDCLENLCEWSNLSPEVPIKQLEVFAKTNDWGQVAEVMARYDWSGTGAAKIYAGYLALSFSDACHTGADAPMKQRVFLADMEASINRSFHNLVSEWNLLPRNSIKKYDLILLCQEFVEFNEAAVLVTDVRGAITGLRPAYPNPKQLLNSWRDRLPDKLDSLKNWHELLNLRMFVFRHIQSQCSVDVVASSHIAPYLHDYPWSIVKLAEVSLNHSNIYLAQSVLSRFQASVSKSTDAFNQEIFDALRQQTRISRKSQENTIGLNVLNCCAISNSNSQQAAEIAWMQGRFLLARGDLVAARVALELSVNAYPMIVGAWITLGDLFWTLQEEEEDEGVEATCDCLRAYLQAVSLCAGKAVRLVSRILCLVRKLASVNFVLDGSLDPATWPSIVWLGWVPTLVRCLADDMLQPVAKALLVKVGAGFPQAVVWQDVGPDIVEAIHKVHPITCSQLVGFAESVSAAFDGPGMEQVIRCWDDMRFKRKSAHAVKNLLQLKTEPSESSLAKMIVMDEPAGPYLFSERGLGGRVEGVDMPGNYTRFISVPTGSALESMSGVRVVGWAHEYEPHCTEEAGPVPRVTLVGNNGLRYSYTVHSGRPVGEGIGEQVYGIINSVLDKYRQSKRRDLHVNCLQSIPLSANCFLRESVIESTSLHGLVPEEADCDHMSAAEVKRLVAPNGYPETLLIDALYSKTTSAEEMYTTSKEFSTCFATYSIVDYILGIHASSRSPKDIRVSRMKGTVYMAGFGLFELVRASETNLAHSVPFRLTRNIVNLIGERNMQGLIPAVMRAAADAIRKKAGPFAEYLELLSLQEEQDESYSENFTERIKDLLGEEEDTDMYAGIIQLMEESMDAANLANVQPKHFLPWF